MKVFEKKINEENGIFGTRRLSFTLPRFSFNDLIQNNKIEAIQ
jgi:hypothetical protein